MTATSSKLPVSSAEMRRTMPVIRKPQQLQSPAVKMIHVSSVQQRSKKMKHCTDTAIGLVMRTMLAPWTARSLGTALDLGIVEALCQQGRMTLVELGHIAGCTNGTDNLYVVLRCLARAGLVDELDAKCFAPNAATQVMRRDQGPAAGDLVSHLINDEKWLSMLQLPSAVKNNTIAFEQAHGMDVYEYGEGGEGQKEYTVERKKCTYKYALGSDERRQEFGEEFMRAMTWFSTHSIGNLFDIFDWSSIYGTVMDVGGGHGRFLAKVLKSSNATNGVLYDRPWVLDSVPADTFAGGPPVRKVAGDVLRPYPEDLHNTVDLVVMKHFLSAFSDDKVSTILQHIATALKPDGRIFLLQSLVAEPGLSGERALCDDGVAPASFAVEIMCDCPGGRWRMGSEWKTLFAAAGFSEVGRIKSSPNMAMMIFMKK